MHSIALHEITAAHWRATLRLTVQPDQQRFIVDYTPIATLVLAKAYIRPGGLHWIPYTITTGRTRVGLLALAYQPDNPEEYWLYHLFIDQRYQERAMALPLIAHCSR